MKNVKVNLNDKDIKEIISKDKILESKKIQRFLNSHNNPNTRPRYEYHIIQFFQTINTNPETYLNDEYEFLPIEEKKKLSKLYKKDIEDFKNHLTSNPNKYGRDFKPPTIRTILSVVKSLFTYNDIDLPKGFWERTNNFKNSRTSLSETPTPEQLRKILDNTDLQGKCLFGIMKDSGSRINSVVLLKRKDIDINREYPIVNFFYKNVKNGITKKKRITPETKHFLQSYFEKNKFKPEDRIFPMTRQNANYKWNCAIEKTQLYQKDENTNRLTMTTHCLKRFFQSYTSTINKALSDYFTEHGNLNDRYFNLPDEELDKEYAKIVNNLLVYERPYDTDKRIKELQGQIKILSVKAEKTEEYENRLNEIEDRINTIANPNNEQVKKLLSNVSSNLREIGFSENIIKQVEKEFPECLDNLRKLPKDEKLNLDYTNWLQIYNKLRNKKPKENGEPHSTAQKD